MLSLLSESLAWTYTQNDFERLRNMDYLAATNNQVIQNKLFLGNLHHALFEEMSENTISSYRS